MQPETETGCCSLVGGEVTPVPCAPLQGLGAQWGPGVMWQLFPVSLWGRCPQPGFGYCLVGIAEDVAVDTGWGAQGPGGGAGAGAISGGLER